MATTGTQQEQELIRRAQRGNAAAFEALLNTHARYVYNLALRLVHHPQEAEDLAQEAFIRTWQALPRFRGESQFTTWLYQIVTNLCYNRLPTLKKELLALDPEAAALSLPDARPPIEHDLLSTELRHHLHQAIDQLPQSHRLLVTLRYLQEMSYEEISQVTGLPLGTVKTGIFRARNRLRESLAEFEVLYE
ncbi:MAG: sigma-70 family RNA polymerase sigma factor [Chloroflexi bacterium]|nr:sigma-70 family RNA polymerase sigma factor [Chloroflexota bacterium]